MTSRTPTSTPRLTPEQWHALEFGTDVPEFRVDLVPHRDVVIVAPVGELDIATVANVTASVDELRTVGFDSIVVDLARVRFMDACGVRLLLGLAERSAAEGWSLGILRGPRPVARVIELTGTADRLPFVAVDSF